MTLRLPDPLATDDEIVFLTERLEKDLIIPAYSQGCFPWPTAELDYIPWCCPKERAVLFFEDFFKAKEIIRVSKKQAFTITINQAFEEVIMSCAQIERRHEVGTWITDEMIRVYSQLHREGIAHSLEARNSEGRLVGGIYGVLIKNVFSAESMFHHVTNASKHCLWALVSQLKTKGHSWMDVQVESPHLRKWGARIIQKQPFLNMLALEQKHLKKPFHL